MRLSRELMRVLGLLLTTGSLTIMALSIVGAGDLGPSENGGAAAHLAAEPSKLQNNENPNEDRSLRGVARVRQKNELEQPH